MPLPPLQEGRGEKRIKEEKKMVVKMVEEEGPGVWTCKNCGCGFVGMDEDRPSGKFGLCPECYLSKEEIKW